MANPYASTGSVATVTANVAGDGINGLRDPSGRPGRAANIKPMSATEVTRRLFVYVRPYRLALVVTFIASALSIALQLYAPILIGEGIDLLVGAGKVDFESLLPLLVRLAVVVTGAAAFQLIQGFCVNRLSYKTIRDLRVAAHAKLSRVPLSLIDRHAHGDLIARVTNDVDQVGDGLLQGMTQLFTGAVTIVGTIMFMMATSVPMALVVIVVTPLSVFAAAAIARLSTGSFSAQMRIQGQLTGYIEEYVGNQKLVDAFAYGARAREGFAAINRELYAAGERAQFLSSLSNPGTRLVNNIMYGLVAVVGCVAVITGAPAVLTVGQVQVFLSYTGQYTKPFNEISGVVSQIQGAYASTRRVFSLLDADEIAPDVPDAWELGKGAAPCGEVEFRNVDFSYTKDKALLQDTCIHAKPGMRMALVGPTGCGKTTLINLLLRFYDVDAGEILVDGRSIRDYTRASLRRSFGMVLQESWLFEGTVHDNIAYGCPSATREQVVEAAKKARVDTFIRTLPNGYDTVLPEDGGTLSQGQRQLLCIARVMLADPAILLLDEATSSIDTRTELQVQAAFDELMQGRTSFVVAHRLSTIREADCILVLKDGHIVEHGTHAELLQQNGVYSELYNSQFSANE